MSYDSPGMISNFLLEQTTLLTAISFNACCILTVIDLLSSISFNQLFQRVAFFEPRNKASVYQRTILWHTSDSQPLYMSKS